MIIFFTVRVDTTSGQGWCVMSVSHDKIDGFEFSWSSWLVFGWSGWICNHLLLGLLQALGKICRLIYIKSIIVNKIYAHLKYLCHLINLEILYQFLLQCFLRPQQLNKSLLKKHFLNFQSMFNQSFPLNLGHCVFLLQLLPPSAVHVRQRQKLFLNLLRSFHHHFMFGYPSVPAWNHLHIKICLAWL